MNKPLDSKERLDIQSILGLDQSSERVRMRTAVWKWGAITLLACLLLSFLWWFGRVSNAVQYITEPVTHGNLTVVVTATGSLQPTKQVDVSSELSGTVKTVLVDYNSSVDANQLLAELDTEKLKATLGSSRAKLQSAVAKVNEAEVTVTEKERDLARKKQLGPTHAIPAQDIDQSQAAYDRAVTSLASARADVATAQGDVQLNEANLAKAAIRSPINGVVLKRNIDPGQIVASTLQAPVLFSIAEDLKRMEVRVDVDEAEVGRVKLGQQATFTVDAFPDRRFPATIRSVRLASETIQGVVTYKAILDMENSDLLLRPGMTATAEIKVAQIEDAILIPNAALRYAPTSNVDKSNRSFVDRLLPGPPQQQTSSRSEETGPNRTVWVLRDGVPAPVKIVIGLSDGKRTVVQNGPLAAGEALVVDQTVGTR